MKSPWEAAPLGSCDTLDAARTARPVRSPGGGLRSPRSSSGALDAAARAMDAAQQLQRGFTDDRIDNTWPLPAKYSFSPSDRSSYSQQIVSDGSNAGSDTGSEDDLYPLTEDDLASGAAPVLPVRAASCSSTFNRGGSYRGITAPAAGTSSRARLFL